MKLTVRRLGHLGDGIAEGPGGGPIFVPGALPGEEVEGEIASGRLVAPRILTPSPDRVRAPCPHYRACGGCSLMHVRDEFVSSWKEDVVRTALSAQGLSAPFRPIATSPERSRRRATFAGRRTRSGTIIGFHGRASGTIADIPECRLLSPALLAVMPALHDVVAAGASRSGELDLSVTATESGPDLAVSGGKEPAETLISALSSIAERHDLARIAWNGEVLLTRRAPLVRMGAARVALPHGAFLQATAEGEAALVASVRAAVAGARRIADLFAGCGTFALPLAEGAEVVAVEGDGGMTAALDAAWRGTAGLRRITTQMRDLFRRPLLPDELAGFDAAVIDPPRAGAEAQTAALAQSSVPLIAAVSCNPVTFARDARILVSAGFRLDWVRVIDQFRWSPHVELAARFVR